MEGGITERLCGGAPHAAEDKGEKKMRATC